MKRKIQILPSGIALVDKAWGGLYRGGTYLLIGAHKSGRTSLSLEFVKECSEQKEVCLYFTTRRPKDLILQAISINFDLQNYIAQNSVVVVRVDSSISLRETRESDSVLAEYIQDIVGLVEQYQPAKIVFDELTPFLGFKDTKLLEDVFTETIEVIEDSGITSIFVIGDPITSSAKKVVDILASRSTGIIYLQKKENADSKLTTGIMAITPNMGHSEGKFKANYSIVPGKGFDFALQNFTSTRYYANGHSTSVGSKYKSLSEITTPKEQYLVSNLYGYEDFSLIVNNQIAFYKSTGQAFTLISFKMDETAEKNGILTLNQLRNAVRLSVEKKDKICVLADKVIVLISKEEHKDITGLIARLKGNLYAEDDSALLKILSYISVYALCVDESVNTSEDLLKELRSDELKGKNKFNLV
jgi:KaiC/GvpD/RAD55 family RecA-like ATPase